MNVFFTKNADRNFENIQKYLAENWGPTSKEKFIHKTKHSLELLKLHPELGTKEVESKNIYGLLLHKHIRMFYKLYKDRISVLALFDVRQNPGRRPK